MLNDLYLYQLLRYCLVLSCSAGIVLFAIPSILHVARRRHLYDDLGHFRKEHDQGIPRLGGVAMFVSFVVTVLMFAGSPGGVVPVNCLVAACVILLAMGLKDDLYGVNPSTKFFIQFIVSLVLVICGDIRIESFYGLMGIGQLPYFASIALSIFCIILINNAYNLIDGIDGLAATLGIMANAIFAACFIYLHQFQLACIALAMVGAILGFLKYNISPAQLFMGDTGSLLTGLVTVVMGFELLKYGAHNATHMPVQWFSAPALVMAVLITPLFDTVRVFIVRVAGGKSPFHADRNHVHHRVLRLGFNHMQATGLIVGVNMVVIFIVVAAGPAHPLSAILFTILSYLLFNWTLTFFLRSRRRDRMALRNLFV